MEDLVRVGIADPAEEARIGQCALERVTLAHQPFGEVGPVAFEHLESAALEGLERGFTREEVDGCPARRARLGEGEDAGGELEQRERDLPGWLGA